MARSDRSAARTVEQDPAAISSLVREVAEAMLDELSALAATVTARILSEVPDLDVPEIVEIVGAMSEADGALVLDGLVRGAAIEDVVTSDDFVRGMQVVAHHRIPLPSLLRAYRVGHAQWWNLWAEEVRRRVGAEDVAAVVAAGSRFLFAWVDLLSDHATTAYLDEERRLARQASVAQAAFVRDLLTSDPDDLAAASRRLGYELGALHLAVVLTAQPGQEITEVLLEQTARRLADSVGTGRRLAVPIDSRTGWIWIAVDAESDTSPTVSRRTRAGVGRPARGLTGFRTSHREALEASRIAELTERPLGSATGFAAIELAALCTHDIEACRRFVRTTLGPLAVADDQSRRLLATLRVFFREGANYRAAARQLGVHHNTVVYRVTQAEELLGHSVRQGRIQLEVALDLALTLGDVVLAD